MSFMDNLGSLTLKLDELGKQLLSLASLVPDGMVVFFVSYDYLDKVVKHFKKSNILDQLNEKKQVRVHQSQNWQSFLPIKK